MLDAMTSAEHHCFEGHGRHAHRYLGLALDALSEAAQQTSAAHQIHTSYEKVLREFGGSFRQAAHHRCDDAGHHIVDREADLLGIQQNGLRQAAHQVAPAYFSLVLVANRVGRTDGHLDLLGGTFADRDAMLAPYIVLNCCVDVETADSYGLERYNTTEADDGGLASTAADIDDHVAHRFVDR